MTNLWWDYFSLNFASPGLECLKSKSSSAGRKAFSWKIAIETDSQVSKMTTSSSEIIILQFRAPRISHNPWHLIQYHCSRKHDTKCCWLCVKASRNFKPTLCEILHNNSSLRILHLCCRSQWIYLSMTGSHYSCFITSDSTRVVFETEAETHLYLSKSFYLSIKPAHISLNCVWPTA